MGLRDGGSTSESNQIEILLSRTPRSLNYPPDVIYPIDGRGCARERKLIVLLGLLFAFISAQAQESRVVLHEDFESFRDTRALKKSWPGGPAQLVTNAPGGGNAASHDGNGMNRHSGFFLFPDATHNVVLTADFFDFATNLDQNVTVSLNSEKGTESVAMGLRGVHCYAARVNGFAAKTNWFPFKRGQLPVVGWHRFKATISLSNVVVTLDLGGRGLEDRTITIPLDAAPPTFTQLRFGGYAKAPIPGGTVLVDNLKLELVSIPAVLAAAPAPPAADPAPAHIPLETDPPPALAAPITETPSPVRATDTNTAASPITYQAPASIISANPNPSAASPSAPTEPARIQAMLPWAFWWISGALVLLTLVMLFLLIAIRRSAILAPRPLLADGNETKMLTDGAVIASSDESDHWRERALHAEAVVAKQARVLSSKVGPDLVEFAKEALVQGLYSQRNDLVEAQAKAKQTLAELEARLAELHLPAQERVRAYEERITELEKQLGSRDDEMRELTRATLLLVRQRLEQTKHAEGTGLN